MNRNDWLVGGDRRSAAAERIYDAATDLIAHDGMDAFDIDILAARVHCSRATIYRHAGGKAEIRDAVLIRSAARIVETVRECRRRAVWSRANREGNYAVALRQIRSHPLGEPMINSLRSGQGINWLDRIPSCGRVRDRPRTGSPTATPKRPSGSCASSCRCCTGPSTTPIPSAVCWSDSSCLRLRTALSDRISSQP